MANEKKAEENHSSFLAWSATKTDEDFKDYVHRGILKRSEIAAECQFGWSALLQNPAIKKSETALRNRGILPPIIDRDGSIQLVKRDREESKSNTTNGE